MQTERGRRVTHLSLFVSAVVICLALLGLAGCSNNSGAQGQSTTTVSAVSNPHPSGPAAALTAPSGGNGAYMGEATPPTCKRSATSSTSSRRPARRPRTRTSGTLTRDGRWTFAPDTSAPYRTRVLVRPPAKARAFSGTVVVEWLNVSGGVDADPDWSSLREEIVRAGDAWVGVSAQRIGVEGGPVLVKVHGVPGSEAGGQGPQGDRSGALRHARASGRRLLVRHLHPGRPGRPRRRAGLGGLQPKRLIAAGESQSAFALVTYFNGVQPLTHAFDGFFVHSRGAVGLPLVAPGKYADIAGAISGTLDDLPHRSGRADPRHPDRDRRGEHPQLVCGAPARQRSLPALGGRRHRARRRASRRRDGASTSTAACRSTTARCTSSPRPRCARSRPGSRPARLRSSRRAST